MVKKLKKQYETPNEGWNQERINREDELIEDYGLKNKREVYKAQSQLRDLRREARKLVASENEQEQRELIDKANRLGLVRDDAELENILSLNVTDFLDRRLQTAVNRRGYTDTVTEARQTVVHGHVYVNGQRVTVPGYMLTQEEEKEIDVIIPEKDSGEEDASETDTEETEEVEREETEEIEEADEEEETETEEDMDQEAEAESEEETEEESDQEETEDENTEESSEKGEE